MLLFSTWWIINFHRLQRHFLLLKHQETRKCYNYHKRWVGKNNSMMGFLFRLIDTLCKSVGVQTSLKILKYQLSLAQKMANLSRVFKHLVSMPLFSWGWCLHLWDCFAVVMLNWNRCCWPLYSDLDCMQSNAFHASVRSILIT